MKLFIDFETGINVNVYNYIIRFPDNVIMFDSCTFEGREMACLNSMTAPNDVI